MHPTYFYIPTQHKKNQVSEDHFRSLEVPFYLQLHTACAYFNELLLTNKTSGLYSGRYS
jgi:hypothetical protein